MRRAQPEPGIIYVFATKFCKAYKPKALTWLGVPCICHSATGSNCDSSCGCDRRNLSLGAQQLELIENSDSEAGRQAAHGPSTAACISKWLAKPKTDTYDNNQKTTPIFSSSKCSSCCCCRCCCCCCCHLPDARTCAVREAATAAATRGRGFGLHMFY